MLARNTAYQLLGRGSSIASGLIGVPIFLHYLGAESYGIIGIYISLTALSGMFDLGIPTAVNKTLSRAQGRNDSWLVISQFIRRYEYLIFGLAFVVTLSLGGLSYILSHHWINPNSITPETLNIALLLAVVAIGLRFPSAFYMNCLFSFHAHARANSVVALFSIARVLIPVLFFFFLETNLSSYFMAQILVNGLELITLFALTWSRPRIVTTQAYPFAQFKKTLHDLLPLTLLSIVALGVSQFDKAVLSNKLALADFATYSVAMSYAMGLLPIAYAVGNAAFPDFGRFFEQNRPDAIADLLHKVVRGLCLFLFPIALPFYVFTDSFAPLLSLFLSNGHQVAHILALLFIGSLAQCFTVPLTSFLVAQGNARDLVLIFLALILFALIVVPFISHWDAEKGAILFVVLNGLLVFLQFSCARYRFPFSIWRKLFLRLISFAVLAFSALALLDFIAQNLQAGDHVILAFIAPPLVFALLFIFDNRYARYH